jgi:hypothetical protein
VAEVLGCPEGNRISARALRDLAVGKIVRESQASGEPGRIRYASLAHFYRSNPACCSLSGPAGSDGGDLRLPLGDGTELALLYRAYESGETPYRLTHVAAGPCPPDREESESRLSVEEYRRNPTYKHGRPIA